MSRFIELHKLPVVEVLKNASQGSVQTENLTVSYTNIKAGVEIPLHHHP